MTTALANVLLLLGGFGALYFGAEWLVRGAARIASVLGVSPIVVGLTVVSLGTSAPELVVCVVAALAGQGDLLMGNVLGSNLANIGLILGATAIIRPLAVAGRVVTREIPIMILITVLAYPLVLDGALSRGDGILLLFLLTVYVVFTFSTAEGEVEEILEEVGGLTEIAPGNEKEKVRLSDVGLTIAGAAGLAAGGKSIVLGATFLAGAMGVSDVVIGLTVVAIGTSLPELVTSLVAARRDEADIAVGNIVGSNIFNLTAVLGGAAVVRGFDVASSILTHELLAALILSVLVLPLAATGHLIRRSEGIALVGLYGIITLLISVGF